MKADSGRDQADGPGEKGKVSCSEKYLGGKINITWRELDKGSEGEQGRMDDFQVFVLLKHTYGITVHQASEHGREGGPDLSRDGNLELRRASQVRVCYRVELEGILFLQNPSFTFRQLPSAVLVPKCTCFGFLLESLLVISHPHCKWPLGMATIYLDHIPNPSFSIQDMTHYPHKARNIILFVLGAI